VSWSEVRALCHGLTVAHAEPEPPAVPLKPRRSARRLPRRVASALQVRLPEPARARFHRFCTLQSAALRSLAQVGRAPPADGPDVQAVQPAVERPERPEPAEEGVALRDVARPGDWLLSLGASWHRTDYGDLLERMRRDSGLRTGMLFYDLIPLRRPEWCHHTLVESFGAWLDGVLPSLDALFAISDATARDVSAFLSERNFRAPGAVRTIPVGTGFPASADAVREAAEHVPDHALPAPGSYVLFVSTIEARKNHALMFQVWRRLAQTLPPDEIPTLVFAGRIGWLVADLMLQIANTNYCDGKLLIVEDPSDAVLVRLYAGCLFTVLPSLFEGWGLPVTESLAAGKPCITSNVTSLPEAGGGQTRMLDPLDLNDAVRVIGDALADRDGLAQWEQAVRRSFEPVPWTRSADVLLDGLDAADHAAVAGGDAVADA
jgi:glycosyltransferase involved in cell wall biosynthesis